MRATMRLQVGDEAPDFTLPATGETAGKGQERKNISLKDYRGKKNVLLAFVPAAFTKVWSAQMPAYEEDLAEFSRYDTQVLGISTDNVPSLENWAKSMGGLSYPLLSDFWPHGQVALKYGVLREEGICERALFVIDKQGIIRYIDIHPIGDQPDNAEIFEVLKKL